MNTLKLYNDDSYIKEFTATVLHAEKTNEYYRVILDRTAFFPEGGGQFADTGVIGDAAVLDVQEIDGNIWHYCDGELEIGKTYTAKLNFEERYDKMQQHSGEHIVSAIVNRDFGYNNVGFHLGNEFFTMDFDGPITDEQLLEIEKKANEIITKNVKIYAVFPNKETLKTLNYRSKGEIDGEVRLVYIDGVDVCACCAPHLNYSGEIGIIKFLHHEKNKGGIRIYAVCGARAINDIQIKYKNNAKISALLCAVANETAKAVENLIVDKKNLEYKITALKREKAELKISALPSEQKNVCMFESGLTANDMRYLANIAAARCEVFAVFCENRVGFSYVCAYNRDDISEFSTLFNEKLCGKGGVSGKIIQGSVSTDKETINNFFLSL